MHHLGHVAFAPLGTAAKLQKEVLRAARESEARTPGYLGKQNGAVPALSRSETRMSCILKKCFNIVPHLAATF